MPQRGDGDIMHAAQPHDPSDMKAVLRDVQAHKYIPANIDIYGIVAHMHLRASSLDRGGSPTIAFMCWVEPHIYSSAHAMQR